MLLSENKLKIMLQTMLSINSYFLESLHMHIWKLKKPVAELHTTLKLKLAY